MRQLLSEGFLFQAIMSYAEKLKDPRWQKKRLQILDRDNWTCKLCGDTSTTLHIHHKKYTSKYPWQTENEDLDTLCSTCHAVCEYLKKENKHLSPIAVKKISFNDGVSKVVVIVNDREIKKIIIASFSGRRIYDGIILTQATLSFIHQFIKL